MMLWKCCTQYVSKFGKLSSGHRTGKVVFTPVLKKGNTKECSNYCTIALISHASKVTLKILQARLQQYMNRELPDVQAGFRKGRGTRDQIANIHTVRGFGIVNKAEIDVFLELSSSFDDPADVGNLISGSSAFSKTSWNIWKFTVHVLLKPNLENFEHYFTSMWDECHCAVVWAFFGIAFLWNWNEKWPFSVLWPLLSFPNLLAYWVQHFHSIIFQDLK